MPSERPPAPAREVVVVGAVNVDLVVAAPRLPGPGETVVGGGLQRHGGGKGANAAVAAARAGARVHLVGAVGEDDDGARTLDELRLEGVMVDHVAVLPDRATGVALIVVDVAGENQIAVGAGANAALTVDHVRSAMRLLLPSAGCVLVSTEIPGDVVAAAVEAARKAGVPCILNPAPVIPEILGVLDTGPILTPNATEVLDLVRILALNEPVEPCPESNLRQQSAAELIAGRTGAPVVTTLGGDGALLVVPGEVTVRVPPCRSVVRDTTGAGDTFNGVLATRLAAGDTFDVAVDLASIAGAISVGKVGARRGMPTAEEIAQASRSTRKQEHDVRS